MYIVIILVFVAILIGLLVLSIFLIKNHATFKDMIWHFRHCNVIVAGKKGSGKDILFQKVINYRKEVYYSNIDYGHDRLKLNMKDYLIKNKEGDILTYNNFLQNKVFKSKRQFIEGADHYISEGGILFPSHMDSVLHKTYPSLPVFYALSRHLYNCNVHCNLQNFIRLWKPIREQSDFYVYVHRTIKLPFILITKYTTYEKLESAEKLLKPMKTLHFNKFNKSEIELYNATNGIIKSGILITRKKTINYDTRAFEKMLLKGKRKTI